MPLNVCQYRGQAARHRLHDVEGQSLAAARRHTDIGGAVIVFHIAHEPREPHTAAQVEPFRERPALVEQRPPSGKQQHDPLGQVGHGLNEHALVLAAGELRRVNEHQLIVFQRQLAAQPCAFLRCRRLEAFQVDAHAVGLHDAAAEMILPRDALVLPVHGQKPVGHGRGHALRRKQKLAFESRRVAVEQIAVRGIHHDRPLPAAEHDGEPGKKRRERGVNAYHVVLLLAYQAAQLHNCREIARRKHTFFERNRNIPRHARQLDLFSACRRVNDHALLRQPRQVRLMKRCQMAEGRGRIQHLSAVFQVLSHHRQ